MTSLHHSTFFKVCFWKDSSFDRVIENRVEPSLESWGIGHLFSRITKETDPGGWGVLRCGSDQRGQSSVTLRLSFYFRVRFVFFSLVVMGWRWGCFRCWFLRPPVSYITPVVSTSLMWIFGRNICSCIYLSVPTSEVHWKWYLHILNWSPRN